MEHQVNLYLCRLYFFKIFYLIDSTAEFTIQSGSVKPLWNTYAGGMSTLAVNGSSGVGTYNSNQPADNIFDGKTNTIYSSRGNQISGSSLTAGLNTGFSVTIAQCQPTLVMFRFATVNAASTEPRDPLVTTVEGTNCNDVMNCTSWTLLYNGTTGLDNVTDRWAYGPFETIPSPQAFTSYRFLITAKRANGPLVSYSEVELYGY